MPLVKPRSLKAGDRIAAVSPSWGGPGDFPARYQAGKRQLEAAFGVTVVDMSHTLAPSDFVGAHPEARAEDLMAAFSDPAIDGIFATIGGSDSIRLLRHLDIEVIRNNPKVFLGFSDTTSIHLACHAAGLSSFYGPSIMAGFGENGGMHRYAIDAVRRALFETEALGTVPVNTEGWTTERLDWADASLQQLPRKLTPATPPRILQGRGRAIGRLLGGCAEVLEMVKGTAWWPTPDQWRDAIFFFETSEESPSPHLVRYWLRNYAAQGILDAISGLLLARPDPNGDPTYECRLEQAVIAGLAEAGRPDLPVLSGLDFGHTQPMLTLPYGALAELDCETAALTILESGVV